jgi:hypothetical protein
MDNTNNQAIRVDQTNKRHYEANHGYRRMVHVQVSRKRGFVCVENDANVDSFSSVVGIWSEISPSRS